MAKLTVRIPGKAWNADPGLGGDPFFRSENPAIRRMRADAVIDRRGRGFSAIVTATPDDLRELLRTFEHFAEQWVPGYVDPECYPDGRACGVAAKRIRAALAASGAPA